MSHNHAVKVARDFGLRTKQIDGFDVGRFILKRNIKKRERVNSGSPNNARFTRASCWYWPRQKSFCKRASGC